MRTKNTGEASVQILLDIRSQNLEQLEYEKDNNYLLDSVSKASNLTARNSSSNLQYSKETNKSLQSLVKLTTEMLSKNNSSSDKETTGGSVKQELQALGGLASSLSNLLKVADKVSPNAGKNIEKTLTSISNIIQPLAGKEKTIQESAAAVGLMAGSIQSLGFALALATPLYIIGAPGALLAAGSVKLLSWVFESIDGKKVEEGSRGIKNMALSIVYLGGAIVLFSTFVSAPAVLGTAASVLLLGGAFAVVGIFGDTIREGAYSLGLAGLSIGVLALGMFAFKSTGVTITDALTIAGSSLLIGGVMLLAGKFAGNILMGALALSASTIPIFLLGFAIKNFKDAEVTLEDVGVLSASIIAVGGAAALAGAFAPVIILGSVALMTAGLALHVISSGLNSFKDLDWKEEDSKNLSFALGSIRVAFLGGDGGSKGILSAVGGFFTGVLDSARMIVNAGAMVIAGGALIAVSFGLKEFKKVNWSTEDSEALTSVFVSITKSFSILTDKKMQAEYGINTTPYQLMQGVMALSNAGNTITSLAKGIQSFANLTFPEWEFNESTRKMELVGKTKLSPTDIETAGINISNVISVVGKAFAEVGKLESGGGSSNPILNAIFTGGYVRAGVRSLSSAGSTIVSLAKGVQSFANLSFTDYEVKDGKLVPVSVTKMSSSDIENAGLNISKVISVVGKAFAEVGVLSSGGSSNDGLLSSIFGGGGQFVKRGVEALRLSGRTIINLAQGVKEFANLSITEYGVEDVNGVPTLVPISVKKMTEGDLDLAGQNISKIISVVGKVFAEVGRLNAGEGGSNSILGSIFGTGMVESGVKSLSGVGDNLNAIASAIPKYANLSFVKMGIQDIDGKPTLVPMEVVSLTEGDLETASVNISKILGIVASSFANVGKMATEGSGWFSNGYIDKGVKALNGVGDNLSKIVDSTMKVASMQMPVYDSEGNITSTIAVTDSDLANASLTIRKLLGNSAETMSTFGKEYGEGSDKYKSLQSGIKVVGIVSTQYGAMVEALSSKSTEAETISKGVEVLGLAITNLVGNVFMAFDTTADPLMGEKLVMLERFSGGISTLAGSASGLSSTATSMEKIGKSMQVFKDNVNAMDPNKLKIVDSLFNSFAVLANMKGGIDNMARTLKVSIEESMEKLAEVLNEMNGTSSAQLGQTSEMFGFMKGGGLLPTPDKPIMTETNKTKEPPMLNAAGLENLESVLRAILNEIQRAINNFKR